MNSLAALSMVIVLGSSIMAPRTPLYLSNYLADDPPPVEQSLDSADFQAQEPSTITYALYLPMIGTPMPQAFHRSGQTFITWPESTDLDGELYRIYRSNQFITRETLPQATLVGEVGKGSANFYTNRYHKPESNTWQARYVDRLVIDPNGSPIRANWGLFVWTVSVEDLGGANSGVGYYAITINTAGGDETFSVGMQVGPIQETVSDPMPVELSPAIDSGEGGHIYIQYMDLHSWNPTFHAPNPSNDFYGLDPNDINLTHSIQYAYDYQVFTPPASVCGGGYPDKIPVFFHIHGWRWFTSSGEEGYPPQDRMCAYGIYPIDVTNTWYFGFAKNNDYRKNIEPAAGDVIVNYTEQRLLRMLYDLMRNPPGPAVDEQRIYMAGQSMGGTGSLAFAERYPNVFAATYASQPLTDFRNAGVTTSDWVADASGKWGRPELNLPILLGAPAGWANPIQKYNNVGVWDWEDLNASANGTGAMKDRIYDDMALLGFAHGTADTVVLWDSQGKPLYSIFSNPTGRPWGAMVTANNHQWEYYRGLPPFIQDRGNFAYYFFRPFWDLQAIRDETVPGLSKLSGDSATLTTGSYYNQTITWSASWNNWGGAPTDTPSAWEISLCAHNYNSYKNCGGIEQTATVTPRRVKNFPLTPNTSYRAQNCYIGGSCFQTWSSIISDSHGLISVPGVKILPDGSRLKINKN